MILTSISVGIGHISQKGWGQDSKSQRGRGDAPGTSAGTLAAVTVVSSGAPTCRKTAGELCPLHFLHPADGRSAPVWVVTTPPAHEVGLMKHTRKVHINL